MALESCITKSVLTYLNSLPCCVAEKLAGSSQSSGKADINGCINGRSFRIEMKTPDNHNKSSLKQDINLRRWFNAGSLVMVSYSAGFVKHALELCLNTVYEGDIEHVEENWCVSWAKWKAKS